MNYSATIGYSRDSILTNAGKCLLFLQDSHLRVQSVTMTKLGAHVREILICVLLMLSHVIHKHMHTRTQGDVKGSWCKTQPGHHFSCHDGGLSGDRPETPCQVL